MFTRQLSRAAIAALIAMTFAACYQNPTSPEENDARSSGLRWVPDSAVARPALVRR